MDAADALALEETLRRRGIAQVLPAGDYFPPPHPIDILVAEAADRIAFLCCENGPPEHLVLTGFARTPLVLSVRQIALSHRLRSLENPIFDDAALRARMAESIALATMAEFFLPRGPAALAAYAFMRSRLVGGQFMLGDSRALFGLGSDLFDLSAQPMDEDFIATFFYGLAHELGHVRQFAPGAQGLPPWCGDAAIEALVAEMAAVSRGDAGAMFRAHGPAPSLKPAKLRLEAGADIEAARMLARLAPALMREWEAGRQPEPNRFVAALLAAMLAMSFIASCRRQVGFALHEGGLTPQILGMLQQPIAFLTRQALMRQHMPVILFDLFAACTGEEPPPLVDGPEGADISNVPPDLAAQLMSVWDYEVARYRPVIAAVDAGLLAAMAAFQPANFSDAAFGAVLRAYWEGPRGQSRAPDHPTSQFLALAQSMALGEERLAELRRMLLVD